MNMLDCQGIAGIIVERKWKFWQKWCSICCIV